MATKRGILRTKKAISPVIATVVLVAVTITVAISVAYWMGGISGLYTRFEKVEISSAYVSWSSPNWTITINCKNTGSADATVDNILINGKPTSSYSGHITTSLPVSLSAGGSATITISIQQGASGCSSGTTIEVKLHTAAGKDYPQMVTLT